MYMSCPFLLANANATPRKKIFLERPYINDKNCLADLLCASKVSIMNYCMPLRLKYTAYTEFLVIAVWNDDKAVSQLSLENFGGFTDFQK